MKTKRLHNGLEVPILGLGTFLVPNSMTCYETIKDALDMGYRHIDTAMMYQNEQMIGKAIKDSKIPRKDIFITSKQHPHGTIEVMNYWFEEALKKLDTDYIDLYLIHWPDHDPKINAMTWSFFESLYDQKKVRAIGVSNFLKHHLMDLNQTARIKPMVNQVEFTPALTQNALKTYLDQENIAMMGYGPFMRGHITEPPFYDVLLDIAQSYHISVYQLVIAWGLSKDVIMIPKSIHNIRLEENFQSKDILLKAEDIKKIDALNMGKRYYSDPDNHNKSGFITKIDI